MIWQWHLPPTDQQEAEFAALNRALIGRGKSNSWGALLAADGSFIAKRRQHLDWMEWLRKSNGNQIRGFVVGAVDVETEQGYACCQ